MGIDLKALAVILLLTGPVWLIAGKLLKEDPLRPDFVNRRAAWFGLTLLAFVAPSIETFCALGGALMVIAARRDSNPAALFVFVFCVAPPSYFSLSAPGIGYLLAISPQRLLALTVLVVIVVGSKVREGARSWMQPNLMDLMVLGFAVLDPILMFPHESLSNNMRRLLLAGLDSGLVFYVFSRLGGSLQRVENCLYAWMFAGLLMAPMAIFENLRGWLLYVGIPERWGNPNSFGWLMRGSTLRAQVSTGHALALGYWMAISWGIFFSFQRRWASKWVRYAVGALILAGLWASYSRGPWLMALLITVIIMLMDPRGGGAVTKGLLGLGAASAIVMLSPLGDAVIDMIPFVGNVDDQNVDYRKRLLEVSWPVILQNPVFGDPFAMSQLESLRQGQGIIDIMNGYISVALFNGFVGLGLFVGMLGLAVMWPLKIWMGARREDTRLAEAGALLVACMLGSMFFIASASYGTSTFILAGLCASLWRAVQFDGYPSDEGSAFQQAWSARRA